MLDFFKFKSRDILLAHPFLHIIFPDFLLIPSILITIHEFVINELLDIFWAKGLAAKKVRIFVGKSKAIWSWY